ncbi:hypothetical protein ANCDUO_25198 [Ancylostoma duodenale]|uniref:Uncharacterized protein n=1 Tax=Ancylostoma duodenale TaxID=51022 RepID=A0A0C2FDI4_9BILA|nr:hypothetical protein ANCDUO_25198 [Ancylostoma duodenale]
MWKIAGFHAQYAQDIIMCYYAPAEVPKVDPRSNVESCNHVFAAESGEDTVVRTKLPCLLCFSFFRYRSPLLFSVVPPPQP